MYKVVISPSANADLFNALKYIAYELENQQAAAKLADGIEKCYTDLEDFIDRMDGNINKRAVQNFIKAGVFDSFGYNRRELMEASDIIMDSLKKEKDGNKKNMAGQMSLFDFGDDVALNQVIEDFHRAME